MWQTRYASAPLTIDTGKVQFFKNCNSFILSPLFYSFSFQPAKVCFFFHTTKLFTFFHLMSCPIGITCALSRPCARLAPGSISHSPLACCRETSATFVLCFAVVNVHSAMVNLRSAVVNLRSALRNIE